MNSIVLFTTPGDWSPAKWVLREGGRQLDGRFYLGASNDWIAISRLKMGFEGHGPEEIERVGRLLEDPVSYLVEWQNEDLLDRFIQEIPTDCSAVIDNGHGVICGVHILKNMPLNRWLQSAEIAQDSGTHREADRRWYEVYSDEGNPPYLLVLTKAPDHEYIIQDPQEKGKVWLRTYDFEEARLWLGEDGYIPVDGRMV